MRKFLYLCCMVLLGLNIYAQEKAIVEHDPSRYCHGKHYKHLTIDYQPSIVEITPGWRYDSVMSDEFHGTTIDLGKWKIANRKSVSFYSTVGHVNNPNNIRQLNDSLVMSVTENVDGIWCYTDDKHKDSIRPALLSGWLSSNNVFRYGYIETECYLPKNHHYWPCLWTTGRLNDSIDYDEVDVFERTAGNDSDYPYKIWQNCYNGDHTIHEESFLSSILSFKNNDSITGKTVVFGAEILPEEVVFYINGRVTTHVKFHEGWENDWNTYTCTDIEEMIRTVIIISLTCPSTELTVPLPNESTVFKYFRCYKLEKGDVDTYHPIVFTPSNESTKVYPHVILGGTGCVANVSTSSAIWAEQDIILDKGFELSEGTSFSARVISVPDASNSNLYIQNCHYNHNENTQP